MLTWTIWRAERFDRDDRGMSPLPGFSTAVAHVPVQRVSVGVGKDDFCAQAIMPVSKNMQSKDLNFFIEELFVKVKVDLLGWVLFLG